jgi:hypothetical protein
VRKLLLATAIATLTAAPAFAQQGLAPAPVQPYETSWTNEYGARWEGGWSQRNVNLGVGVYAGPTYAYTTPQYGAVSGPYASAEVGGSYVMQPGFAPSAPAAVSIDGRYLGADPDPFIRQSLIRDQDQILGSGTN